MNVKPPIAPQATLSDSLFLLSLSCVLTGGVALSTASAIFRRLVTGSSSRPNMSDRELDDHYRHSRMSSYVAILRIVNVARTSMRNPRVDILDSIQVMLDKALEIERAGLRVPDLIAAVPVNVAQVKPVEVTKKANGGFTMEISPEDRARVEHEATRND